MCCHGQAQDYLISRAAEEFTLVGVLRYAPANPAGALAKRLSRYLNPIRLAEYLTARLMLPAEERRAAALAKALFEKSNSQSFGDDAIPQHKVEDINQPEAVEFVSKCDPDIVLVNGTNLIKRDLLSLRDKIQHGFLNLHTGLSPYSRGGNCNLFMLLEGKPELVGVTVHQIDLGIDRGDIVRSAQTPMELSDNYEMIEWRSFYLGIEMLLESASDVAGGHVVQIRQWEKGKLFLRRTGYVYRPFYRVLVNRAIKRGLIRDYMQDKAGRDASVRLVGESRLSAC